MFSYCSHIGKPGKGAVISSLNEKLLQNNIGLFEHFISLKTVPNATEGLNFVYLEITGKMLGILADWTETCSLTSYKPCLLPTQCSMVFACGVIFKDEIINHDSFLI